MIDPSLLVPFAAALAALSVSAIGWSAYILAHGPKVKIKKRLSALKPERSADQSARRKSLVTKLRQDETDKERGYRLREQLLQAGLDIMVWQYLLFSVGLTAMIFSAVFLSVHKFPVAVFVALSVGVGLPKFVLGLLAKRRVQRFTGQLADGIDIVVRGIRSGLPLGECIAMIGREMPDPIGEEFRVMAEGQKLGMSLQEVLTRTVERMPIAELRYFAIVVSIQLQTGGNLSETLTKLSEVLRSRKRMRDKVQAFSSEAKASAMIIGSLPFVVMILLSAMSPQYVGVLFTTDPGNVILFVGAMTEIIGIFVMRAMINFEA